MNNTELANLILRAQAVQRDNWLHALHLLKTAEEHYPQNPSLQISLAELYLNRFSYKEALSHYIKALSSDPSNTNLLSAIAACYMATNEYRLALAYYSKIDNPTDDMIYNKALAQAFVGKHSESIESIKQILPRQKNHPFLHFILIEQYFQMHNMEEAVYHLEQAYKNGINHVQLHLLGGIIYVSMGIWLKAYNCFWRCDSTHPISNSDHLNRYAQAATNIGQPKIAIKILTRAIKANPYHAENYANLIQNQLAINDTKAAKETMDEAKKHLQKLDPMLRILQERLK